MLVSYEPHEFLLQVNYAQHELPLLVLQPVQLLVLVLLVLSDDDGAPLQDELRLVLVSTQLGDDVLDSD